MVHDTTYANYHRRYDNGAYRATTLTILRDLYKTPTMTEGEAERLIGQDKAFHIINLLIDSAIESSGSKPYPTLRFLELANLAAHNLTPETCSAIRNYLKIFDPEGHSLVSQDFDIIQNLLRKGFGYHQYDRTDQQLGDLHSQRRYAAHFYVVAASELLHVAELLIGGNNDEYTTEKLRHAQRMTHEANQVIGFADS